jgi:hypothetical protein
VNSTDTLNFPSSGVLAGNTGAKSSLRYNSFNTRGRRYSYSLASENNVLTSFTQGCTDNNPNPARHIPVAQVFRLEVCSRRGVLTVVRKRSLL